MCKSIFTLSPVVAILLASSGVAQAASNGQITITANVVAATCDVSLSNPNLDLGNFSKTAFTAVATPVNGSIKSFTVGLSNCEAPMADATASLIVSGQTLGGNPNIFNSTGTNTGIMLSTTDAPTTYINAGAKLSVATASSSSPSAADFNAKSLRLQAGLASTSTTPDIGLVSAPILFSFAYN